ncbi:MAG: hypothetical protein AB7V46_08885 [Thermomicrobiales bacterium]
MAHIVLLLLASPFVGRVVLPTAGLSVFPAAMLTTTERTIEIAASLIPTVRQEANAAVTAADGARRRIRPTQDLVDDELILTNKRSSAVALVPIFAKREKFRDRDYKNARFSVMISNDLSMSSSYRLDVKTSSGKPRVFYALFQDFLPAITIDATFALACLTAHPLLVSTVVSIGKDYCLEKKKGSSSFPSSGPFYLSKNEANWVSGIGMAVGSTSQRMNSAR